MGFCRNSLNYLSDPKKYWLLPVFMMMFMFGGLLILTKGSALALFVYTLF